MTAQSFSTGISVNFGSCTLTLDLTEVQQDSGNNRSKVAGTLTLSHSGSGSPFNNSGSSASMTLNGETWNWSGGYNLPGNSSLQLISQTTANWITHNDDGSKSISVYGSFSGAGNFPIGSGSISQTFTLDDFTRVPLAPTSCTVSVSGRNATVTSGISDATGRPAISSYQVERTNNDGSTWSGTVLTMDGSRQYVYSNLDGGKYYKFRSRGVSTEGVGAWTESASTFIPAGGRRWTGSAWTPTATAKRWNGSSWVDISVAKRWNGSAWVDLS